VRPGNKSSSCGALPCSDCGAPLQGGVHHMTQWSFVWLFPPVMSQPLYPHPPHGLPRPRRAWACIPEWAPPLADRGRLRRSVSCGLRSARGQELVMRPARSLHWWRHRLLQLPCIPLRVVTHQRSPPPPPAARLGLRPSSAATLDTGECRAAQSVDARWWHPCVDPVHFSAGAQRLAVHTGSNRHSAPVVSPLLSRDRRGQASARSTGCPTAAAHLLGQHLPGGHCSRRGDCE